MKKIKDMEHIVFYILALVMIVFAIASVSSRRMLRSVVYLLFVIIGVAGIYFLIDYNFLAAVQLAVYAGGIIILIIFSVLMVHNIELKMDLPGKTRQIMVALLCVAGLAVFLTSLYSFEFQETDQALTTTTSEIGHGFLSMEAGGFILPFELISVLLLAAIIGAVVIAKREKPKSETQEHYTL